MAQFVPYALPNGKVKRIPMAEINKLMQFLQLSKDEAIQVYLEDEGDLINEEQEALEAKAKENRITATIHQAKAKPEYKEKTQSERVKKDDKVKENIITQLAQTLEGIAGVDKIEIVNNTKLITFSIGEENFKLDLIRHGARKKKNEGQ